MSDSVQPHRWQPKCNSSMSISRALKIFKSFQLIILLPSFVSNMKEKALGINPFMPACGFLSNLHRLPAWQNGKNVKKTGFPCLFISGLPLLLFLLLSQEAVGVHGAGALPVARLGQLIFGFLIHHYTSF